MTVTVWGESSNISMSNFVVVRCQNCHRGPGFSPYTSNFDCVYDVM